MSAQALKLALMTLISAFVVLPAPGSAATAGEIQGVLDETSGDVLPGDSDGDGVLDDDDNCPDWSNFAQGLPEWQLAGNDFDCDGFNADLETHVGTDPAAHCPATTTANDEPTDAWPTDFNDSKTTNLSDVILMGPSYNKSEGQGGYNQRLDLNESNSVNLSDVILMGTFYNKNCLEPPPSSEALIAQALANGEITYEDSLRYRAYALFQTPDLPAGFQSPIIAHHEATDLFAEVLENEATLSPEVLTDLEPFMARPADPISIFNNPPAVARTVSSAAAEPWVNLAAAGGKVRVWASESNAWMLPTRMDKVNEVWPKLQAIFPFDNPDTPGDPAINPDSAIDIYFVEVGDVDPRWAGCGSPTCPFNHGGGGYANYVAPYTAPNKHASAVMIDITIGGTLLTSDIAHELAHVGQHSYDYTEPFWLKDSTAQWAAERVLMELGLATAPELERLLKGFFNTLDRRLTRDPRDEQDHRYASWLFFFHASMAQGDGIVKSIWQQAAAPGKQNEDAVDLAYPFVDNFDDFATHNWNQTPVELVFPLYKGPKPASPLFQPGLKPNLTRTRNLTTTSDDIITNLMTRLSARYYKFTFANNVRKVTFENYIVPEPDAHIWAIPKIAGQWKAPEDWSRDQKKRFCRDYPGEDLQEVIIIVSNSHKTVSLAAGDKLKTHADTESCKGFIGTATGTYHHSCVEWECYTQDWTVTANILWEEDEDYFFGCGCRPFFATGEIEWSWSFSYPDPYCYDSASGTLQAGEGLTGPEEQMLILWEDAADMTQWFYSASGGIEVSWYDDCENGTGSAITPFIAIPVPDVVPVTPTLPPTAPPPPRIARTSVPVPVPPEQDGSVLTTTTTICQQTEFSFPRDANAFSGSCVDEFNEPWSTVSYQWSFTRIGGVP